MKTSPDFPPNYAEISLYFSPIPNIDTFYTYGDTVYNPNRVEIPPDIMFHEGIHEKQQGKNPKEWWRRYCTDKQFREDQETEAYYGQYQFLKRHVKDKILKDALEEMAQNLSSNLYKLDLTQAEAMTRIRKYNKI